MLRLKLAAIGESRMTTPNKCIRCEEMAALLDATRRLIRDIEFLIEEGTLPQNAADHPSMILARDAIAACNNHKDI